MDIVDIWNLYDRHRGSFPQLLCCFDCPTESEPVLVKQPQLVTHRYCFAVQWLCDFSSVGRGEATEMATQFVRFGLITLVSDKHKDNDSAIIFTVRRSAPGGNSPVSVRRHSYLTLPFGTKMYGDCFSYVFFGKRVNSDVPPRRSTRLQMKAYERHARTSE